MISRTNNLFIFLLIAAVFIVPTLVVAEKTTAFSKKEQKENADKVASVTVQKTKHELPSSGDNGSPEVKITIGSPRGSESNLELSIYIPKDHIIRSLDYTLKWEISESIQTPVKLVLTDDGVNPVVEKIFVKSSEAGIHLIDLQSLAIKFEPRKEYQWIMQACSTKACDTPARDLVARTYFQIDL